MLNTPFSPWPSYTQEEADAAARVLLSNQVNYWTGRECREFEQEFAAWTEVPHAIALANGTVALDLALKVLGIGPGDEVIVTPRTFLASASSIVTIGAIPVFADVDADSQNITPETVARVLTPRTRAIIAVHLAGWPCDMDGLMAWRANMAWLCSRTVPRRMARAGTAARWAVLGMPQPGHSVRTRSCPRAVREAC